jgi:hypothetical protein
MALIFKAMLAHDLKESEITGDELQPIVATLRESLQYSGLQFMSLNNAAYALVLSFDRDGDPKHLEEALVLAQRAISICERDSQSQCPTGLQDRLDLSACHDTKRNILEKKGDTAGALASAKLAYAALLPDDQGYAARKDAVLRLQDELPNK